MYSGLFSLFLCLAIFCCVLEYLEYSRFHFVFLCSPVVFSFLIKLLQSLVCCYTSYSNSIASVFTHRLMCMHLFTWNWIVCIIYDVSNDRLGRQLLWRGVGTVLTLDPPTR